MVNEHVVSKGMKKLILLVLSVCSAQTTLAMVFTEIMYDPDGTDEGREWVELFNDQTDTKQAETYIFFENNQDHSLVLEQGNSILLPGQYAIIADDAATFIAEYNYQGIVLDSSWASLSNAGEFIALKDGAGFITFSVNYTAIAGSGKSLVFANGTWQPSQKINGNPGKAEEAQEQKNITEKKGLALSIILQEPLFVGNTYSSLFKIENLDHISGITDNLSASVSYTIHLNNTLFYSNTSQIQDLNSYVTSNTGLFRPIEPGIYTIQGEIVEGDDETIEDNLAEGTVIVSSLSTDCNIHISILLNQTLLHNEETLSFKHALNDETFPFIIEYWIEDLFGEMYKQKINSSNTNKKSWKTDVEERDKILVAKAKLYPSCIDASLDDNAAEEWFFVISNATENGATKESAEQSTMQITDVEDASFGDTISISVDIYKGDTQKYAISAWAEKGSKKVSDISKLQMREKFSRFKGNIPIALDDCVENNNEGTYKIVIEGLGEQDTESIHIDDDKCSPRSSASQRGTLAFNLLNYTSVIEENTASASISLQNLKDEPITVRVWSYVYRGSKSFSGERTSNLRTINMLPQEQRIETLYNTPQDIEPGQYKIKVVAHVEGMATDKELTVDITAEAQSVQGAIPLLMQQPQPENKDTVLKTITGNAIIYESSTEKAKSFGLLLLMLLLIILNLYFIMKHELKK